MIELKVWFPKSKRMVRFSGMWLSTEYDSLCFNIKEDDCQEKYQHLAGESYIPDGPYRLVSISTEEPPGLESID